MKSDITLGETYQKGKRLLEIAGNECAAFDASCIFKKVFGYDRRGILIHSNEQAKEEKVKEYLKYINQRADGRPLQYILGSWTFLEMNLLVGEGVLIPREETELLVYTAAEMIKSKKNPKVIDLCSGTGAVALGLASLVPSAEIDAAELYEKAYNYLRCNIKNLNYDNVTPIKLDVLNSESFERFQYLDCIVANPPYVEAGEIALLQTEVQKEPVTALDGGEDGLKFYRAIAKHWIPKLKNGGTAAVEVGDGQAESVAELFKCAGLSNIKIRKDFNKIERVVAGIHCVND